MNQFMRYLKKKRYIVLFLIIVIGMGILTGLIVSLSNLNVLQEAILTFKDQINNQNNYIFFHFFCLVISLFFSFFGIGIPLMCTFIFYEGVCLGFLIGSFSSVYFLKGFLFAVIYFFITKGIYVFCFIFSFFKCLEIARRMIGKYLYKTNPNHFIAPLVKAVIIMIGIVFLNDLFLFLFGSKIIHLFQFLL